MSNERASTERWKQSTYYRFAKNKRHEANEPNNESTVGEKCSNSIERGQMLPRRFRLMVAGEKLNTTTTTTITATSGSCLDWANLTT